jgi:hypothetical protein
MVFAGSTPVPAPLPRWLRQTVRVSPPKPADLERAWRTTLWMFGLGATAAAALCVAILCGLVENYTSLPVVFAMAAAAVTGIPAVVIVDRRGYWLSRAVAVVGTRPDIGYEGFAALPAIRRLTRLNRATTVGTPIVLLLLFIPEAPSDSWIERQGPLALSLTAMAVAVALNLALQRSARDQLGARLGRP